MLLNSNFEKVFSERYKNLNKEQKKAVDSIEGPVMVVAGPGTGKTTILTLRIAQILRKATGVPANAILAITYTDSGVKVMRSKLREIIGNTAHDVYIHTFHSFASAMIAEYPDHFLNINDFRQITPVEQESLIREIITEPKFKDLRPLGKPDAYLSGIIRAIGDAKKEALIADMVRDNATKQIEKIKKDEDSISTRGATKGQLKADALENIEKLKKTILFAGVYDKYEQIKKEKKLRDYDDLIVELLVALQNDQLLLRLIQERFLYILVDEHQDTNDSQNFIIALLAEFFQTPNIFIVGDEKQAIYRFQGASVENFLRLGKRWPDMQLIHLDTNYRSHQSILDAVWSMIENNYKTNEHKDLRVKLKSEAKVKKKPIEIIIAENTLAMEEYLSDELKRISSDQPEATIAIIVRRNRELERVLRFLDLRGVEVSSERSVDVFHHPVGMAFFDLIEYLNNPAKIESLAKTLASGLWGLSYLSSIELIRSIGREKMDNLDRILPQLKAIRERMLSDGALEALIFVADKSGLTDIIARNPASVSVWRGIVTLAESIIRDRQIDNPSELFSALLSYCHSAELKPVKVSVGAPDVKIKAMTAHGSKGLEFDYVFIPYATEEAWVGRVWGSFFILEDKNFGDHNIEDIRRLFYVALTRAKKHASILYAKEESDGRVLSPLRFINELYSKDVKSVQLPKIQLVLDLNQTKTKKNKIDEKESQYQTLMINEAKKVLTENGLSVTALNHFLECPSKFLYESILKLPQAPSTSSEKGTAMHEAISEVWRSKRSSSDEVEKIISAVTGEYINRSLLSKGDKEALKKELSDNAPAVAKWLFPHFTTTSKVSVERWVEVPFDTIHIHGKLDVILENIDEVSVFDYKTRQAMSVSSIKGEVGKDNGNYFRQLVFYKLLLQSGRLGRNKNIFTSLVFVSPDNKDRCPIITLPVSLEDIKKVKDEVRGLVESVWSGEFVRSYCNDADCSYCAYRKLLK